MATSIIPLVPLGKSPAQCRAIVNGLWQTSGGWGTIDPNAAVAAMQRLSHQGFTSFDGADHYGPSESLMGALPRRPDSPRLQLFTKWCPAPGPMTQATVDAAIAKSLHRMNTTSLDLLQFHWWDYARSGEMMDALQGLHRCVRRGQIAALGLTNFDSAHLEAFLKSGLPISSNQVQFSLVDTRPLQRMAPVCASAGVSLLTYGTLCGGLLTDAWLGRPEPRSRAELPNPSLGKYFNVIRAWGPWSLFQELLHVCRTVADAHGVSIAHVAMRWVLDQPAVAGIIIGLRAGLSDHAEDNARVFSFALTEGQRGAIWAVQVRGNDLMQSIGDCGDEYR